MEITEPLIISRGSHAAGTGEGCVMNVISWENGDTIITDFPPCTARPLARLMQIYNDLICSHTESQHLCGPCAVRVIDLGHQTVGTADQPRKKVNEWLQACLALIPKGRRDAAAAYAAYDAADAAYTTHVAAAATAAATAATTDPADPAYATYATHAATAAAYAAAATYDAYATTAAATAATTDPADPAYATYATHAAATTADATAADAYAAAYPTYATATAAAADAKLEFIEKAVALWHSVCGTTPVPVDVESLNTALAAMAQVTV